MRQTKLLFLILLALVGFEAHAGVLHKAYDSETGNFYLLTKDGHESYVVDGSVTFIASKTGTIPTYRDNGVTFEPKNSGEVIVATVEEIDLAGSNYLLSYNGEVETGKYGLSDGKDQSSYLPAGWTNKLIAGTAGTTITSESTDGKLTFGYHSSSASGQAGFKIVVQSVVPKDMEFVSANGYLPSTTLNRGAKNQIVAGACIVAEGMNNALQLSEVSFDLGNFSATQLSNLRAYMGNDISDDNLISADITSGGVAKVTINRTLKSGNNYIYLVGDLAPDFVGTLPAASITDVKVGGESKTITSAQIPSTDILNNILMPADNVVYTIGDDANFYDDSGIEGKISPNFVGSVTFVPANKGQKIKVDFSKLEIFNTSSTGLNDIFTFYNGRTADADNINCVLLKDKKIVKSSAADGSLTVTLKSTTGVPANGWEAIVSQFTPGNMTIKGVAAEAVSADKVAAADTNQPFTIINITADNILSPKSLKGIALEVSGKASAVKAYSLGDSKTISTLNLFGTMVGSTISGSQELQEGNNYFAIVADIDSTSLNTESISIKSTSVTVDTDIIPIPDAVAVSRIVENVFHHTAGSNTRVMYDNWVFTDTKDEISTTKYKYTNDDCIVTFKPAQTGCVAEITFDKFDVYYSSSSYGVKATYEIYSGTELTPENLIWKLDDASQSTTGPGKVLRSTAAYGAMTIKFNANATSSSYAGKGWNATVRPFLNHNMEIKNIDVEQTSTDIITGGTISQGIINFAITTEGTLSTQTLKSINLDIKESAPVIDKVKVLYSADKNTIDEAVEFGSLTYTSGKQISITGEQALPEGVSNFWVVYDIKGSVLNDIKVDAQLISIVTNDATPYTPANGDPDGERISKNLYSLKSGDNGSLTLNNALSFYDDGGPNNKYSRSFTGTVTFLPDSTSKVVKLVFNSFNLNTTHNLYIYDGTTADESKQVAKLSGTTYPAELVSHSADGALTVRFVSATGTVYDGWDITAFSHVPTALVADSVTTESITDATIMRGAKDVPFMKLTLSATGDKDSLDISEINGITTGTTAVADIKNLKLWYTKDTDKFYNAVELGSVEGGSSFSFKPLDVKVTNSGKYYFWITASVSDNATVGNTIAAAISNAVINGADTTLIVESSAASSTVKSGLSGTYSIGSAAGNNYATINDAVAALSEGVEGEVTFLIDAGTYAENIHIKDIKGSSDIHPVKFTSRSGNNNDVIITGSGYTEPAYGEMKYGMVVVENSPYITFDKLSFIPAVQTYPYMVHLYDRSYHFTMTNCNLQAAILTTESGMNLLKTEAINEIGRNNDYVTVENCNFTGGYIAMGLGGTSFVALPKERGLVVRNNFVVNPNFKGIYVVDEIGSLIEGNTVVSNTTQKSNFDGLDIFRATDNTIIRNNKITITQNYYSAGIYIRQDSKGSKENPIKVYNNSIATSSAPSTSAYGIYLGSGCQYIDLKYNTINIGGTGGYGMYLASTDVVIENNLIQSSTSSPLFYASSDAVLASTTFKKNAYSLTGTKFASRGGDTFDDWKITTSDSTSIEEKAEFLSATDLHLKAVGNLNMANHIDYITTDVEGNLRDIKAPTVGAYEYRDIVIATPVMAEGYPVKGNVTESSIDLKVKWSQSGSMNYMIQLASQEAPDSLVLLAENSIDVLKDTESTISFKGLESNTDYRVYLIMVSTTNTISSIVASDTIATLRHIEPLAVELEGTTVNTGEQATLAPVITGGDLPYTYKWLNKMNEVVGVDSTLTIAPELPGNFSLNVKSADGQSVTIACDILVYGKRAIASFEDNYLASESYWQGSKLVDEDGMSQAPFYSGSFSFTNSYMPSYSYWGGFAYANLSATEFDGASMMQHQFRNVVGKGAKNTDTYAVAYTMGAETTISTFGSRDGEIVSGVYLTNSAYTLNSILHGDSFASKFTTGDYHKVVFTGDDPTGTKVEFYLADYRSDDASQHYAVTDWKWCDLTPLGTVKEITVSLESSTSYVPSYLCLDELGTASSGADNISVSQQFNIYPVPATTVINIDGIAGEYTARIFSIDGNVCGEYTQLHSESQLSVESLSEGTYLLEITFADGSRAVKRFIKR